MNKIIVVCVGNICRSPMAEALLSHKLQSRSITVISAGLSALVGYPADPLVTELMNERDIDIYNHRASQLTPALIQEADLVLVMETWQIKAVESIWLMARGKVHLLGKWGPFEVPDPYRQSRQIFELSLKQIEQGVEDWIKKI
ncbi:hypothetical protein PN36_04290 [Candidatus Thiomargarita nelsonii]|uniref:protein-tyrosine-phosphatase n=1 Tax=Candidatus Thiomargarita nelsonii TaxID=1003181 RepID=A0A0A6PK19_9GAMM|nr:hypothetical protein PN36_04290 [Candidatus Thiomargarita nelsonii]